MGAGTTQVTGITDLLETDEAKVLIEGIRLNRLKSQQLSTLSPCWLWAKTL